MQVYGIKQGCPLSSIIILVMDVLLHHFTEAPTEIPPFPQTRVLVFADDLDIFIEKLTHIYGLFPPAEKGTFGDFGLGQLV